MKNEVGVALALVVCGLGCAPRQAVPPGVRSLRRQRGRRTITVPVWAIDVAEEVAANGASYAGKTLVIERAHLDPTAGVRDGANGTLVYGLRGGGRATVAGSQAPPWLRGWTGAPVRLRAVVHPPRGSAAGRGDTGPLLSGKSIDFAHPLELASVDLERGDDGTWLVAHVENYRGEPARAALEVRFGPLRHRERVGPLAPGDVERVRLKLFGTTPPRWRELPPEARSLRLAFDDGAELSVDLSRWLEGPMEGLLDWGYTHAGPSNGVVVLSADRPEAELERFAALELRSFLRQFTSANIEPREPDDPEPLPALPVLVVGTARHNRLAAALIRQAGLEAKVRSVGAEGYVLKSLKHEGRPALLATAQTARGLMNGVYGLLTHYGMRISLAGVRLPARRAFEVLDVEEVRSPLFARRTLVAVGPRRQWTARWSQWEWLALFDAAAKNRLNEVVVPLDGLRATFAYSPGRSREAVFPFDVGPYSCVAEAYLAHQRGLALVADVARRRGLDLAFARRGSDGTLRRVNRPACLSGSGVGARDVGQVVAVSEEPGDFLGLPRVEEAAAAAGELLRAGGSALAVPFGPGARFRSGFLAQFAWDKALTPVGFYRHWAATLCDGEAAAGLADAAMRVDKLDEAVLAAAPKPFGRGVALALPVEADDLRCEWRRLRARAGGAEVRAHLAAIKAQSRALRELQRQLDPIIADIREALGSVEPPWEAEAFEAATATRRAERITLASYMLRSLLGALASVQEGTLAYYAGLAKPQEALAQLRVASSKYRKARRIMLWIAHGDVWTALEPSLVSTAEQVHVQASRLAEWLGPAAEAEPSVRLRAEGSEAIIHLFRSPEHHVYAVYLLEGHETIQLRLPAARARLFRRGKPPATIEATGGAFLVSVDTTPVYLVTRRAPWPGQLLR